MIYSLAFDNSKYRLMLWDKEQIASIVNDDDIDHLIDINGAPISHKDVFIEPLRVSFAAKFPQDKKLLILTFVYLKEDCFLIKKHMKL